MPQYEIIYRRKKVSDSPSVPCIGPAPAVDYLRKYCFTPNELWRERCFALFLDSGCNVKGHLHVGSGGMEDVFVDHRLVLKTAALLGAHSVILAHNHPNGDVRPSPKDIEETEKLKKKLDVLDVKLLDHIVLTDDAFYSFSEETICHERKSA